MLLRSELRTTHVAKGDDKGEQSKADIVKKLSAAYSDSRTDLRYITGRVRVADGRTAREVNGEGQACSGGPWQLQIICAPHISKLLAVLQPLLFEGC